MRDARRVAPIGRGAVLFASTLLALSAFASSSAARITASADADPLAAAAARAAGMDVDGDGIPELLSIVPLPSAGAPDGHATGSPLALVLVEDRLLDPLEDGADLRPALDRHLADLRAAGFSARAFRVALHRGGVHRDGLQVLALRRFLIEARDARAELSHVMLVGAFPHALLVRTVNWRRRGAVTVGSGEHKRELADVSYLRSVPEAVAQTCDLVLADLDGRWEPIYVRDPVRLPTVVAVADGPVPDGPFVTDKFTCGAVTFEDFFHVNDGRVDVAEVVVKDGAPPSIHVVPRDHDIDDECSREDLALGNPIARPDIVVSRLNACGVALSPRPEYLDEAGAPRAVTFEGKVPGWSDAPWQFDPVLERRLLIEYFERNHAYRTAGCVDSYRPASLAHSLPSGFDELRRGDPAWSAADRALDVKGSPDLTEVVRWFRQPAVLRTIRAHSDPWGSVFDKLKGAAGLRALLEEAGGVPWSWTPRGDQLEPSLESACQGGKLDYFLLRTMWANGVRSGGPSLYIHTGCEAISPPGWRDHPWWSDSFGRRAGGDAVLFFAEGLALVGRSKVFYDEPSGVSAALGRGETIGDAWRGYFEIESGARSRAEVGGDIGRKRAYFWSVLGDGTLRLIHPRS